MAREQSRDYILKRKKLSGVLFETALPNEYLVEVGKRTVKPVLGGRRFRLFRKFLRVPGAVETLHFSTDNANVNYQGIGVDGYASWRIDPERPERAIATLDFFDEDNPMRDTNEKLKTICVEAVRHVIANMTIDDALKKEDEIGDNLKEQLRKFEDRWGILFDQVGIEKVRIMSEKLFEDLQSEYRDELRLDVSRARIQTDRKIAGEENSTREVTETERMATERKLALNQSENEAEVKQSQLEKDQTVFEQERQIKEDRYRKQAEFERVQQESTYSAKMHEEELKTKLQESEYRAEMKEQEFKQELQKLQRLVLESEVEIERIRTTITQNGLEPVRTRRLIEQMHTPEQLSHELISSLPEIYKSLKIDNFSIMNTGTDGSISPIGKVMQEVIGLLRANNLEDLLRRGGSPEENPDGATESDA